MRQSFSNLQIIVFILLGFGILFLLDLKVSELEARNSQMLDSSGWKPAVQFKDEYSDYDEDDQEDLESEEAGPKVKALDFAAKPSEIKLDNKANLAPQFFPNLPKSSKHIRETWRSKMKNDPKCNQIKIEYAREEQLPVVLLASHEGSGSDWVQKFLEVSSGYFCGNEDKQKQVSF